MNMESIYDFLEQRRHGENMPGEHGDMPPFDPDEYRERKQAERQELFELLNEATKAEAGRCGTARI